MLNIASVNMPKIKPETKVLIIKNLKSKSPAEVADIFNVSKLHVERIRKCYQETFIKNCTSDSWSYRGPETSAKQETAKKPRCVRQGPQPDGRLNNRKFDFRWIVSWAPSQAPPILSMTLRDPSGPMVHPEDSQIWRWKDYGLGLHPIRRCQGDL